MVYTHHDQVKTMESLSEVLRVKTSNFLPSAIKKTTHALPREKVLCPAAEALQTCMIFILFLIAPMLQPLCLHFHFL